MSGPGTLQRCGYFDSLATDHQFHREEIRPLGYDGPDPRPFDQSRMAGILGAAVAVICDDGRVLLQRQPASDVTSAGKWTLSGNGSTDPEDVRETLYATFEETARRELLEESSVDLPVSCIAVVDAVRRAAYAHKPEALCVARVPYRIRGLPENFAWFDLD